jgi:50S ribosomal protein L16 3-hydroxylase
MLYLPPGVPHHGVAEDPCLTFSIGMRAPSTAELLGDFIDTLAADADESLRYADPDLTVPTIRTRSTPPRWSAPSPRSTPCA